MNQITIEELSAYLPFKPKAKMLNYKCDYVGKEIDTIIGLEQWDKSGKHWSLFTKGGSKPSLKDIKLLLRPLSQLTTEIEVNGEKFVPIEKLREWFTNIYFEIGNYSKLNIKGKNETFISNDYFYLVNQHLLSWHFDIFGLLDRNLAEPIV